MPLRFYVWNPYTGIFQGVATIEETESLVKGFGFFGLDTGTNQQMLSIPNHPPQWEPVRERKFPCC